MGGEGFSCWRCGERLRDADLPVSRHSYCAACHEPLHCCRMCRFFSEQTREACLHDAAEPPGEKETANFCDFFRPGSAGPDAARDLRNEGARQKLNSLFGEAADAADPDDRRGSSDPAPGPGPDLARARLDDLFDS